MWQQECTATQRNIQTIKAWWQQVAKERDKKQITQPQENSGKGTTAMMIKDDTKQSNETLLETQHVQYFGFH